ncbi:MAG: site-specific integrase [Saprospiraceae bacterium]|nr:site-specific integrase [Saprospiraceae bacterium]
MIQGATIRVTLYKSKTLANGEHPLMLVVTKDGKRKYEALGLSCHPDQWDFKKCTPKRNHPEKLKLEAIVQKRVSELQAQVLDLKMNEKEFSSESLLTAVHKPKGKTDVLAFFSEYIQRLIVQKKVGNANVYRDTFRALKTFQPKIKTLLFSDIDLNFLNRFETHLRSQGLLETSISVYFRTLRSLYNKAVQEKLVSLTHYPFRDFKISKFDTDTRKRAISKTEIQRIAALDLSEDSRAQLAQDVFMFSYFVQGINLTDIAMLRWSNLKQDRIYYIRAKTGKGFNIKLMEPAVKIMERYRIQTGGNSEDYIFPILDRSKHLTPVQIDNRIHKMTGCINKSLKQIAKLSGLDIPLTTYVARHTYATVLKNSGVPVAIISEALGHESESITQTYLKSFENEVIEAANQNLI